MLLSQREIAHNFAHTCFCVQSFHSMRITVIHQIFDKIDRVPRIDV